MSETTLERFAIGCTVVAILAISGCGARNTCVPFGTDMIANFETLAAGIEDSGLKTTDADAAYIVGWARASSQVESGQLGAPVRICLRPGSGGATEFRVFSIAGDPLGDWQSTADRPAAP